MTGVKLAKLPYPDRRLPREPIPRVFGYMKWGTEGIDAELLYRKYVLDFYYRKEMKN